MTTNSKSVLIVDDHVIIRRGMKFILETNFGIQEFLETESCAGLKEILAVSIYRIYGMRNCPLRPAETAYLWSSSA